MIRLASILALAIPAVVRAQGAPPPPPPLPGGSGTSAAAAPGAGAVWAGGSFGILPQGSFSVGNGMGGTVSSDLATAYALDAVIEYQLTSLIAVGVMPRYVFNVIASDATVDSGSMLDLRARVAVGLEVAPRIRAYGFGAVGYAIVFPPSSAMTSNPSGLTVTGGAGGSYAVNPRLRFFGEAGYELGFQSTSTNGMSTDTRANYLEIDIGIQAAFGG